jgi:hypothetical protein
MTDDNPWIDTTACTLPTAEQPLRVAEFDDLFRTAVREVSRLAPGVLVLRLDQAAEDLARNLVSRETECCSFFGFSFTADPTGLLLRVEVPAARSAVLDGLADRAAGLST